MKLLLDENLPHELRYYLAGHAPYTAAFMGWKGISNGDRLDKAAGADFDVVITKDTKIEYEQDLTALPVAVLIIQARANSFYDFRPLLPAILSALATIRPKTLVKAG